MFYFKNAKRILASFLSVLLVLVCIGESSISLLANNVNATTVSDNSSLDSISHNDVSDSNNLQTDLETNELTNETEPDSEKSTSYMARFYTGSNSPENLLFEYSVPYKESYEGNNATKLRNLFDSYTFLAPVRKGYKVARWLVVSTGNDAAPGTIYNRLMTRDEDYVAIWKTTPETFSIEYHLNGGTYNPKSDYPERFQVTSETITLSDPIQKNYIFDGWYRDEAFTQRIKEIPSGSYIDSDEKGQVDALHLYAKWVVAKPQVPSIKSVKNPSSGKVSISWSASTDAAGYELMMSQDKNFKKNTNKIDLGKKTSYTLTNMPKNKTYYFKVRSYQYDSTKTPSYSGYSKVKSLKIKKGVKEYKAQKNSGKLKKVNVINQTDLCVTATVSKRIKSSDDSYYLVKVDPVKGTVSKKLAQSPKNKSISFTLPLKDEKGTNLTQGKYAIAVKDGKKYKLISASSFINNPEAAASYTADFPKAASKKGLQGNTEVSLNVHQTYFNILVNQMIASKGSGTPYQYNGKTYYFYDPYYGFIADANAKGITVTGQIMIQWYTNDTNKLILKSGRSAGHAYYALDAQSKESRETLEALFSYMAEQWSTESCHLDNWILGNEVNIHPIWYYAGNISEDNFMKNYADTFRILYYAVKSSSKNSRVYICTDHTWNNRCGDWGAKPFIELFNKKIKAQNKNIQWNLAYHAYPSVLTNAKVWDDNADPRFTTANTLASDFVSPYNLNVLTDYIKKNYGTTTRIILSEQGFTAATGEDVQAAALAYSYYKAEFNDMIDTFLIHDARISQAEDYAFVAPSGKNRPAYNVFRYMNTPQYEKYTNSCLSTIGVSSWKSVTSKFDANKLKSMPMH